jgi:hypothetical protein
MRATWSERPWRRISAIVRASIPPSSSSETDSDRPGLDPALFVVGDGLLLDLDHDPGPAMEQRQGLGERRHPLARPGLSKALVEAGGQCANLGQGHVSDVASTVRRPIHRRVVQDHDVAVAGELHVELDHRCPDLEGARERGQGVLGPVRGVAPVGDHQRVRGHRRPGLVRSVGLASSSR